MTSFVQRTPMENHSKSVNQVNHDSDIFYSVLKVFTGFAMAAFIA